MSGNRIGLPCLALVAALGCSREPSSDPAAGADRPDRRVRLVLESAGAVTLGLSEEHRVRARVVAADGGDPIPGRGVSVALAGGAGGAVVAPLRLSSGPDGRVAAVLTTGAAGSASFQVQLTTSQAAGAGDDPHVVVSVQVDGRRHGELEVHFAFTQPVTLASISVRVHRGGTCDGLSWPSQPPGLATLIAGGAGDAVTFDDLVEGDGYRVTALALDPAGEAVATGCALAPPIIGLGTVTATLELQLRPPVLVGEYDLGTAIPLASTLPPDVAGRVATVTQAVTDPAGYLASELVGQLASTLGLPESAVLLALEGAWALLACTGTAPCRLDVDGDGAFLDDALQALLFDGLYRRFPALADGALAAGDLAALLQELRIGATLGVDGVDARGRLTATLRVTDFLMRWRPGLGCDPADACCGRRVHATDVLTPAAQPAVLVGTLTPRDEPGDLAWDLDVPAQSLELPLEGLMAFALQQLAQSMSRPGITSLDCAVESWMGCTRDDAHYVCCDGDEADCRPTSAEGLAAGDLCGCERAGQVLHDGLAGPLGAAAPSATGFTTLCQLGLGGLRATVDSLLDRLEEGRLSGDHLALALSGVITDADHDLHGDRLEATTQGRMVWSDGSVGAGFTGTLTGDRRRRACQGDRDCASSEVCRPELDLVDDCGTRRVCVPGLGTGAGGAACVTGVQCASGVCATDHRCLQLCVESADCPAPLACTPGVSALLDAGGGTSGLDVSVASCR